MYNENKKSKKIDNEGAKEKIDVENELQGNKIYHNH